MSRDVAFKTRTLSPALVEYSVSSAPPVAITLLLAAIKIGILATDIFVLYRFGPSYTDWRFLTLCAISLLILLLRDRTDEALLVSKGFGVQVTSHGRLYFFGSRTRFIAFHDVLDVVIQEVFRGFEVRPVLLVMVAGEDKFEVVFPRLLPRLHLLEQVWRGSRQCLYDESRPLQNGSL